MISLQATLSSKEKKPASLMEISSKKKRKREEEEDKGGVQLTNDSFIELSLETPLPLEWQRCLDLKSGEIHYYNTRTKRRASKDPTSPLQGLDLELSLMCTEPSEIHGLDLQEPSSPSIVVVDASDEQEMVAMVCGRCHMLVMMYKLSPLCPNCKFSNSPGPATGKIIGCGV
ncbi:uncharacterized protein LOC110097980 [Dendrobium catenatum]|uniref:WW domain-containing protein n=1 Tax=Dendrobium catenatum TaxID=906689 RepID=A0A2I0WZX8_9ASPA|nr:uncharacterized protein LOC110097980 [Dendrobium catenatum]PKU81209.1 hypothetical protein MA16_Dca018243 [Dendrobium catenatum]